MKYETKKQTVEAMKYTGDNSEEVIAFLVASKVPLMKFERSLTSKTIHLRTPLENDLIVGEGEWLIFGPGQEFTTKTDYGLAEAYELPEPAAPSANVIAVYRRESGGNNVLVAMFAEKELPGADLSDWPGEIADWLKSIGHKASIAKGQFSCVKPVKRDEEFTRIPPFGT